ncbi:MULTISPECIES: hypothetical protein [Actinoplanes]|uniref:hypothetical protein n=1 Tax=Actinoplanes TaxID=1865 RepID=UPI000B178DA9|nr:MULTISPECIES: hypothetical protein [Actinoplanes]GLY05716.1 hypothetical protein Acsp01_60950 [Actinoplanes sp. NBRC 101535]
MTDAEASADNVTRLGKFVTEQNSIQPGRFRLFHEYTDDIRQRDAGSSDGPDGENGNKAPSDAGPSEDAA